MGLALVWSRAQVGLDAPPVAVEVNLAPGLPGMTIVGLPEAAVREAKDRVRAAIQNSGFEFPARRITINLAPADLPKDGGRFDLAMAVGMLVASGQIQCTNPDGADRPRQSGQPDEPTGLDQYEFYGELSLSGAIRPVRGCLPAAIAAAKAGRAMVVCPENAQEAALAQEADARSAGHLLDVSSALSGGEALPRIAAKTPSTTRQYPDLADVRGQHQARHMLEIAATGGHSLLMSGPPGTGKSMLAARLPGLLPSLSEAESLEVAALQSIGRDGFDAAHWGQRPHRAPHHSASAAALVGGGGNPQPGEISRAHHGVLFLDELPEFDRRVLESLREPMEAGTITISRAARQIDFPAKFQLVAAMNPCACGFLGDVVRACRCSPDQVTRYQSRLSGPLLDRIDLRMTVNRLPADELARADQPGESTAVVRQRVAAARSVAMDRQGCTNAELAPQSVDDACQLSHTDRQFLATTCEKLGLSARSFHRLMRVSRTIADMENATVVQKHHLAQAISARRGIPNLA